MKYDLWEIHPIDETIVEYGEVVPVYSDPTPIKLALIPLTGDVKSEIFGEIHDCTMTSAYNPKEHSIYPNSVLYNNDAKYRVIKLLHSKNISVVALGEIEI